ncbi:alpha/beta hydrolase family protein [Rhizobium leguminosarum]|uniref:alpha/beta hydrolase family protein n=1 Tax=Rhizobium leguminosarum TaxID=384 RepID=UPI0010393312|nr:alpha/beta fold hydrolase [Rhizobium leguminosarum]MBY5788406.1 alpha/beta hydrolase [Rhizobium leguminosarum]NKL97299.1 alpha/beta fold hydrolase [Rhizobium leguminosarum bv. viciae]TBZ21307.1 alpha/beta fold hydrolase [Rhizobium leguminosarum bv. viciae]
MKQLYRTVAASLGVLMTTFLVSAQAKETIVKFKVEGQTIVATMVTPDDVAKPPVVLMLHGFTGSRNEWSSDAVKEGLFGRAAPVLAKNGIASLRIDFRGSGESDGKFEDMTVETEITDAQAALDFLSTNDSVDGKRISLMGMSLGGAVTTAVAGRTKTPLKSVVLWNPGINLPAAFISIFGEKQMAEAVKAGDNVYPAKRLGDGKDIPLKGRFFESLYAVQPAGEISRYKGPLFLAVGTRDNIVFPQPALAKSLLSYHDGPEELWTESVDHGFGVERSAETVDKLISATVAFLKSNGQ